MKNKTKYKIEPISFMKKTYPTSKKARSPVSYNKHMEKREQRKVNKSTRKLLKREVEEVELEFWEE